MDNLENEVLRRSTQVPVIVLIGTSRSPDSEQLRADFTELAANAGLQFIFGYIDADTHPDVAQVFGVQGLPTVIAVAAGRPLADFQGGQPADALAQWTGQVIQAVGAQLEGLPAGAGEPEAEEPGNPLLDAATEALNAGDFDRAEAIYTEILEADPGDSDAAQARETTRLLARLSAVEPGRDVLAEADAEPDNLEKAVTAADALISAGDPAAAFDRIIAILARSGGEAREAAKQRLLEYFGMFDAADPRVLAARGKMASALF